jgi:hypothetical protein
MTAVAHKTLTTGEMLKRLCGWHSAWVMFADSQERVFRGKQDLVAIRTAMKSHNKRKEPAPHVADAHGQGPEGCSRFVKARLDSRPNFICACAVQALGKTLDPVFLDLWVY